MSESNSDLDYESADEDTSCGISVQNNNTAQTNSLAEKLESESPKFTSPETKPEVSNTGVESLQTNDIEKECDNLKTQTTAIPAIRDRDSPSSESNLPFEKEQTEGDIAKNNLCEKVSEKKEERGKLASKAEKDGISITSDKVRNEKHRVPLRLEKKIQQKQQMSKEDSTENEVFSTTETLTKKPEIQSSSWGFGSWGTNLLSTAASSVTTFTNQVSQGIGTVLESVESTLGAPSPEELATTLKNQKEQSGSSVNDNEERESNDAQAKDKSPSEVKSAILPNVSSWTKVLENTGSRVIMGGLDTLELIGKKTIDIITEGDPGLRKKRAALDGITLSQILREAKAEADESKQDEDSTGIETVHYSQLFDEYQGLVHLEALEMLSKQSEAKIQMLLMKSRNSEIRKNMEEIKSICENIPSLDETTDCENFEDFLTVCKKYVLELNLAFSVENIIKAHNRMTDALKSYENSTAIISTPEEIYHSAICSLAEFTAKSIEAFHKFAELILVQTTLEPDVEQFASNLTGLTTVICIEINNLSSRYHQRLDSISEQCEDGSSEKSNITAIVTNLYLEASNSNKYIQDAFLLLVPVLQVSLLESLQ